MSEERCLSGRSPRQWQAHIEMDIQEGLPGRLVVEEMVRSGFAPAEARARVSRAVRARNTRLGSLLGCSSLFVLMGVGTIVTAADTGSGWVWIGAVVCGLVGIVYSVTRLLRAR